MMLTGSCLCRAITYEVDQLDMAIEHSRGAGRAGAQDRAQLQGLAQSVVHPSNKK